MDKFVQKAWEFIRGDLPVEQFEKWVYSAENLADFLNPAQLYDLLNCDYQNNRQVWEIKKTIRAIVEQIAPHKWACLTWANDQKILMGWELDHGYISETYPTIKKRTPWLKLVRCQQCNQFWDVAIDTIDDDDYLHRLDELTAEGVINNDVWLTIFNKMDAVWPDS